MELAGMIAGLVHWYILLLVVPTFGALPGLVLRLIVRMYRTDEPRRREYTAEFCVVPRCSEPSSTRWAMMLLSSWRTRRTPTARSWTSSTAEQRYLLPFLLPSPS